LAKKIALEEAAAVSLEAELEVERKLEEGRAKVRDVQVVKTRYAMAS
jgi:hypothetical protein